MTDVNALKGALLSGIVTIKFTKVNGTQRTMVATLEEAALPPKNPDKTYKTKDPGLLVVHDVEMNGWRTVKVDSILEWYPGPAQQEVTVAPVLDGWKPKA